MKQFQEISKIIHKEGYIFIILFSAITFILAAISSTLGWIGFIATCWCVYFFRNPERFTPTDDKLVVAPADGVVQRIMITKPPAELNIANEDMLRISIFLSVFNVHVNRVPATGKILQLFYNPGKFFNASLDKASIYNERQSVLMETDAGHKIAFIQIAGLVAKRIVCDLEEGMMVKAGERFGIIRFGSRMDIYLPLNTTALVCEGQTMIGGETILADLGNNTHNMLTFARR